MRNTLENEYRISGLFDALHYKAHTSAKCCSSIDFVGVQWFLNLCSMGMFSMMLHSIPPLFSQAKPERTAEESDRLRKLMLEWQFQKRLQESKQSDEDEEEEDDEDVDTMMIMQRLEAEKRARVSCQAPWWNGGQRKSDSRAKLSMTTVRHQVLAKYRLNANRTLKQIRLPNATRGECGAAPTLNVLQCASATCFCHRFAMLSCWKPIGRAGPGWMGFGRPNRKFVQNPMFVTFNLSSFNCFII